MVMRPTPARARNSAAKLPTPEPEARSEWEFAQSNEWFPLTSSNYPSVRTHKLLADCGVAQVARNDFAGALQTFLRTDYWSDAAYIAERLLVVLRERHGFTPVALAVEVEENIGQSATYEWTA